MIHLYYNEFEANNDYCVDVVTKQEFVVNEASDAGIKVYDFDNKGKKNLHIIKIEKNNIGFNFQKMLPSSFIDLTLENVKDRASFFKILIKTKN